MNWKMKKYPHLAWEGLAKRAKGEQLGIRCPGRLQRDTWGAAKQTTSIGDPVRHVEGDSHLLLIDLGR